MEKMNDLKDLLRHEIQDLVSAEDQILKAMPAMIQKAKNPELKKALKEHQRITEQQRSRLDQVMQHLDGGMKQGESNESKGLFSRLMARRHVCKGMEGILEEGERIMGEDMNPEVMDAAIIASAQKVEHYEICGYGTAKAYARELNLTEVERLLDQTLNEEYMADDLLTQLAVGRLNREAESSGGARSRTAAASQSGMTSRSEGGRATSRERSRIDEPEMEMARGSRNPGAAGSTGGRTAGTTGRTSTSGNAGAGRGDTASRGTSSKGSTGAASTSRTSAKSTGRNSGTAGNKGTSGRGGNNSRTR